MRGSDRNAKQTLAVVGGALLLVLAGAPGAHAQATRTWVSGVGDDVNPCSRTAPCKTFAGAISKTAAGGEISVLDPGGYGAVTITKAITITSETAGEAGVLVQGTDGVVVQAGPNDAVTLRGLVIHSLGAGLDGIRFMSGRALHVEKTLITGFAGNGINATLSASADVTVADTEIRECGGSGIALATTVGAARAALRNVRIQRVGTGAAGGAGVLAGTRASVTLDECDLAQSAAGIVAQGSTARVFAAGSEVSFNGTGVLADAGGRVRLSENVIVGNSRGLNATNAGVVESFSDNRVIGNTVNGAPTIRRSRM